MAYCLNFILKLILEERQYASVGQRQVSPEDRSLIFIIQVMDGENCLLHAVSHLSFTSSLLHVHSIKTNIKTLFITESWVQWVTHACIILNKRVMIRNLKSLLAVKSQVNLSSWRPTLKAKVLVAVVPTFNLSIWESHAGGSLNWKPAWITEWIPRQPELHRETLSLKNQPAKNLTHQNNNRNEHWECVVYFSL